MNNSQHNHLDMFRRVAKHATDHQPITNTIPAFANGILALKAKIAAIEQTSGEQSQALSGVSTDKQTLRIALCEITFSVISPVRAYALANNNNTLAEQMNYSLSDLKAIQDDEIGQKAQTLLNTVNPLVPALPDYGITAAIITAWQAAIDNYMPVIASPQTALSHRASLTEDLKTLFKEANTICKKTLDPISIGFKPGNAHYYNDFLKSREIIDIGTGQTRGKGNITHAQTGEPIYNARISYPEQEVETTSDVDGNYETPIKPQPTTILVEADGFKSKTKPAFNVSPGSTATNDFTLEPETPPQP